MAKKFKLITNVISNEVSLCTKYNSGANKQTQFELVKNKENTNNSNMKETIKKFLDIYEEGYEETCPVEGFKDFLEYWVQHDLDNMYYNLLSEALQNGIKEIQYIDKPKIEKEPMFIDLFNMFLQEFNSLPISKTKNGEYIVSLVEKSHIKEVSTNPQNETNTTITKEKTSEMETKEEMNLVEKAIDTIVNALGLKKTESPTEETPEAVEQPVEKTEEVEQPVEEAQVETPVVEEVVEKTVEEEPVVEEVQEQEIVEGAEKEAEATFQEEVQEQTETQIQDEKVEEVEQPVEEAVEEVQKSLVWNEHTEPSALEIALEKAKNLENELAELKKQKEEQLVAIEKMSFAQKAKDEFSMLVGTPEEIGEKLYSISKSSLSDVEKDFIFEQFKKVSAMNKSLTEEVGSITEEAGDMSDEQIAYKKAEEIAKSKGISVNKALREIK